MSQRHRLDLSEIDRLNKEIRLAWKFLNVYNNGDPQIEDWLMRNMPEKRDRQGRIHLSE